MGTHNFPTLDVVLLQSVFRSARNVSVCQTNSVQKMLSSLVFFQLLVEEVSHSCRIEARSNDPEQVVPFPTNHIFRRLCSDKFNGALLVALAIGPVRKIILEFDDHDNVGCEGKKHL